MDIKSEGKYIASTIVRANDIALNGNLFGGTLLRWLDEYGALFVYKYLKHTFVTYKMGETKFLKTAKLGELIDFYVCDVRFNKISVSFKLLALNSEGKEIIHTEMTFVAINIETEKPVIINPELFEFSEFKKFFYQKFSLSAEIKIQLKKYSLIDYKAAYLGQLYLNIFDNDKVKSITELQKDYGNLFTNSFMTNVIQKIDAF